MRPRLLGSGAPLIPRCSTVALASARPFGRDFMWRTVGGAWWSAFHRPKPTLASRRDVSDGRAQPYGTVRKDKIPSRRAGGTPALRGDDCRRVGKCCPRLACPSSGRCYGWSLIPSRPHVKRKTRLFSMSFSVLFSVGGVLSSLFAPTGLYEWPFDECRMAIFFFLASSQTGFLLTSAAF